MHRAFPKNISDKLCSFKKQIESCLENFRVVQMHIWSVSLSQRLPCATGLLTGLDYVSVLLEPPPGYPVPLSHPAGDPFSSQTHWPILLPFLPPSFLCLSHRVSLLQLLPNSLSQARHYKGETGTLNVKTLLK